MRRFWTYVGAVLPLATAADYANGSVNPHTDFSSKKHPGRADGAGSEEDAAGGSGQNDGNQDGDDGSPSGSGVAPTGSSALEGGNDALTQEIRGLLDDLDRMSATTDVDSPMPMPLYSPAASEMYAPVNTAGAPSFSGAKLSALADDEDAIEAGEPGVDAGESGSDIEGGEPEGAVTEADVEDVDSMLVALGGTAGGADGTMPDGDIDLEIVDYGKVTVAIGKAEFNATSDWDGTGQPPEAYAETFLDVYDADLVFFYHVDEGYSSATDAGMQYTETSTLYVVAIDFEDDHPLANEFDLSDNNGYQFEGDPGLILAAMDGTPEDGYFSHPLLDGIPFLAFSQYYSDVDGEVHLDGSGSDLSFVSTVLDGSEDAVVLVGDVSTVEDSGSSSDLVAQTDNGELSISVSGFGPDTYAAIDAQMIGVDDDFSGITGLAIGIA